MSKRARLVLIGILLLPCLGIARLGLNDLRVYRQAGELAQKGAPEQAYLQSAQIGNYFDGPVFLSVAKGLAALPETACLALWILIQTVAYLVFWVFLLQLFPGLLYEKSPWPFLLVWLTSIKPIHASFQSHNVQLMIIAVLVFAEVLSRSPKTSNQLWAGILPTLLAAWKIYPGFLVVFYLLSKTRSVRLGILLGAVMALVIPVVVFGPASGLNLYPLFITNLVNYHSAYPLAHQAVSLSLPSLMARWLGFLDPITLKRIISAVVLTLTAAYFVWVVTARKKLPEGLSKDWWGLTLALMVFLNNGSRPDYFVFYIPAFAILTLWWVRGELFFWGKVGLLTAYSLMCLISEWTLQSRDLTHFLEGIRIPVVGMFLLCLVVIRGIVITESRHGSPS